MVSFGTYEDFRKFAINSEERLETVSKEKADGTVVYYVHNLGYRSFITPHKLKPDYLKIVNDFIPKDIDDKVNKKYEAFSFKMTNLNHDLIEQYISTTGIVWESNFCSASTGVSGKLCNKHLIFLDKNIAKAYHSWSIGDKESNENVRRIDNALGDYY